MTTFADRFSSTSYSPTRTREKPTGFAPPPVTTPNIGLPPPPPVAPTPVVQPPQTAGPFMPAAPTTNYYGGGGLTLSPPAPVAPATTGGQIAMPGITNLAEHPAYASLLSGNPLPGFTGLGGEMSMPEIGMGRIPSWNERASQFYRMSPYMQKTWLQDIWGPASGLDPNQILDFILEQTPGYKRYPFRTLRSA